MAGRDKPEYWLKAGLPWKRLRMQKPEQYLERLRQFQPTVNSSPYKPFGQFHGNETRLEGGPQLWPVAFDGHYIQFTEPADAYETINILSDYYMEELRLACVPGKQAYSPLEFWSKRGNIIKLLADLKTAGLEPTDHNMREALYGGLVSKGPGELALQGRKRVKECTQFRPTYAKSIYSFLGAQRVLDMSAGWGDRLLAAISLGLDYTGVDPAPNPYARIIDELGSGDRQRVIRAPFEQIPVEELAKYGPYDLMFSSPPFFGLELYSPADPTGQSTSSYPTVYEWFWQFLIPSLEKAWSLLRDGGYLAVHLSDYGQVRVVEPMLIELEQWPDCQYKGLLSFAGARSTPTFVWQKRSDYRKSRWRQVRADALTSRFPELYSE